MSYEKLEAYLQKHKVDARILKFDSHTITVEHAEKQLGVSRENIIKSMLFIDEQGVPVIAIITGDREVSEKKLAEVCGAKRVKIARPRTVKSLTGYEAGGVPPFGHKKPIKTIIDPEVMTLKTVFGGGGAINALLEINPIDVKRLTEAEVADISEASMS